MVRPRVVAADVDSVAPHPAVDGALRLRLVGGGGILVLSARTAAPRPGFGEDRA